MKPEKKGLPEGKKIKQDGKIHFFPSCFLDFFWRKVARRMPPTFSRFWLMPQSELHIYLLSTRSDHLGNGRFPDVIKNTFYFDFLVSRRIEFFLHIQPEFKNHGFNFF
jgi:hypothetical protein